MQKKKSDDATSEDYNPFEHRDVKHPTTDLETFIHLLKGALGTGLLAMPYGFKNAGLVFGFFATIVVGLICTYCVHILVKCAHIIYQRLKVPSLSFAEVAEAAFLAGPEKFRKFAKISKAIINWFLIIDLLGCCIVYVSFVASNLKPVFDPVFGDLSPRVYIAMLLPILIGMNMIRDLKYLAPFSMIANACIGISVVIIFYYIFSEFPSTDSVSLIVPITRWPMFFGTVIFALEAIGVVMALENNMKNPTHFIGCPSVLTVGMGLAITMYTLVGFFGYLKYGAMVHVSISVNLPMDPLAQSVKVMIAIAIFFTYTLQFFVPFRIIWSWVAKWFKQKQTVGEYVLRACLVIFTALFAIAVPDIGPFLSLVGAICLSVLGLMYPSIIELVIRYDEGYGRFKWILWKNLFMILFGIIGLVSGTMVSILDLIGMVHGERAEDDAPTVTTQGFINMTTFAPHQYKSLT